MNIKNKEELNKIIKIKSIEVLRGKSQVYFYYCFFDDFCFNSRKSYFSREKEFNKLKLGQKGFK